MTVDYDVLVIGSGFGGSVAALRLTEKGYRVGVLEAGRRFDETTLPRTSWDVRRFLWAPRLGCRGIQRIHRVGGLVVLAGAGVGGGSLVYANTLYEPAAAFFEDRQWRHITDWRAELAPHYAVASRMLGVNRNPLLTPSDEVVREVAGEMGAGDTFRLTPVGVFFGGPGVAPGTEVEDPYFGGAGPRRTACLQCGACMTGCRHGAKNTLDKNYLHLAERAGAAVHPDSMAVRLRPVPGGYAVDVERPGAWRRRRRTFTAREVVLAAGTYGTQLLLHRMRAEGRLPRLSPMLGVLSRTNSEALLGAQAPRPTTDFTRGVAITSSFHPDPDTHIEPVRYGKGSNAMGLLRTLLVDGDGRGPRWLRFIGIFLERPLTNLRALSLRRWSERTIILLVMQSLDNSITVSLRRGWLGRCRLTSRPGHGRPNPTWIPAGHEACRRVARRIGGLAGGTWGDVVNVPMTAHFIGGCVIGDSPETGVVDPYHRVYGHPGLHVVDGSAVSANLGVNPSLTITAQAERAMALWPNRGEPDPRPPVGAPYRRVAAVAPARPATAGPGPAGSAPGR
jgi:cholesterol oxidase